MESELNMQKEKPKKLLNLLFCFFFTLRLVNPWTFHTTTICLYFVCFSDLVMKDLTHAFYLDSKTLRSFSRVFLAVPGSGGKA